MCDFLLEANKQNLCMPCFRDARFLITKSADGLVLFVRLRYKFITYKTRSSLKLIESHYCRGHGGKECRYLRRINMRDFNKIPN